MAHLKVASVLKDSARAGSPRLLRMLARDHTLSLGNGIKLGRGNGTTCTPEILTGDWEHEVVFAGLLLLCHRAEFTSYLHAFADRYFSLYGKVGALRYFPNKCAQCLRLRLRQQYSLSPNSFCNDLVSLAWLAFHLSRSKQCKGPVVVGPLFEV